MTELVAVDIGGTHARFALAEVEAGRVLALGPDTTLKTAEHASFQTAWETFGAQLDRPVPRAAAIAVAGPVQGGSHRGLRCDTVDKHGIAPESFRGKY